MASAQHTVLRAHTVVQNFPLRIEAADAWGDALVVGTSEGALLVFAEAEPVRATPRAGRAADAPEEPPTPRYEARDAAARQQCRFASWRRNPSAETEFVFWCVRCAR